MVSSASPNMWAESIIILIYPIHPSPTYIVSRAPLHWRLFFLYWASDQISFSSRSRDKISERALLVIRFFAFFCHAMMRLWKIHKHSGCFGPSPALCLATVLSYSIYTNQHYDFLVPTPNLSLWQHGLMQAAGQVPLIFPFSDWRTDILLLTVNMLRAGLNKGAVESDLVSSLMICRRPRTSVSSQVCLSNQASLFHSYTVSAYISSDRLRFCQHSKLHCHQCHWK